MAATLMTPSMGVLASKVSSHVWQHRSPPTLVGEYITLRPLSWSSDLGWTFATGGQDASVWRYHKFAPPGINITSMSPTICHSFTH
jgi:hypothetical protein